MLKTLGIYLAVVALLATFGLAAALSNGHVPALGADALKPLAAVAALGALIMLAAYSEKRRWNGGICRDNGLPWEYFDSDSQGGRGYQAGDRSCWISYPVDTRSAA